MIQPVNRFRRTRFLSSVCMILVLPTGAFAQTAGNTPASGNNSGNNGVAEITVTAQKRTENAQNVPVAITSLSGASLAKGGIIDTSDLDQVTPGLQYNTNMGGYGQPRIRGIGTSAGGPGIENPVATYVDGVYMGSENGAIMSLADIQQVDVLKGPQGTLFGRNATGGVIQVTTREPTQDLHAEGNITYGDYQTWGGSGYVSGGLADGLAAMVSGVYSEQDKGYGVNLATGQQVGKDLNGGVRAKLLWQPDSDTKITLSADYSNNQGSNPVIRTTDNWTWGALPGAAQPGGRYDTDSSVQPYLHTQVGGTSLTIKHDFGNVAFTSISAYRQNFYHVLISGDQAPVDGMAVEQIQKERQVTQEFQLNNTDKGPFKWVIGLFYMGYDGRTPLSSISGAELCGGVPGNSPCTATVISQDKATLSSYAAFAQGTYSFGSNTDLTLGARYTLDQRSLEDWQTYQGTFYGVTTPIVPDGGPSYQAKNYPKPTWRVALNHRFSSELMVYATYNRGFMSGTFQPDTYPIVPLKVETVDAYEGGFKADLLDRKLRVNVSGFYYNYDNIQANQIANGVLTVYDAPGSINYGIDADLTARPTRHLSLTGGISWLHARYKNGFTDAYMNSTPGVPSYGVPITVAYTETGAIYGTGNASGSHVQNTPDFTANIGGSYDIETATAGTFTINASYYYNGGYYNNPGNQLKQDAYSIVNASLSWTEPHERFNVKVWAKNLTNAYYSQQINITNFGYQTVPAPPRLYGVTLGFKY